MDLLNEIFLLNLVEEYTPVFSYFVCVLGSVASGLLIGWEREMANKPAGLRTFAFVALGSSVFTLASTLAAGADGDRGRITAQIVTGIGFIGAGAVFRSGKFVSGLTTAAGIWTTGAIGVIFGLGYLVFGMCITLLVVSLFWLHRIIEMKLMGACNSSEVELSFEDSTGRNSLLIEEILDNGLTSAPKIMNHQRLDDKVRYEIRYCSRHKAHRHFLNELATCPVQCRFDRKLTET